MSHEEEGTYELAEPQREVRYRRFKLNVIAGPDKGKTIVSDGQEVSIGTADGNELVLQDATVSRHHCVITATSKGFLLRDLQSTNGLRLGGYVVHSALLTAGAKLAMGRTQLEFEALDEEVSEPISEEEHFGNALGRSAAMRRIFAMLPRLARVDTSVLIEGETGTGKTLIAEALHRSSPRASAPFVVVDCAATPRSLFESELFGHLKGSFTGAHATRAGAFERAKGGTIFLDEIGELPLELQPKLLRVLEDPHVQPLGANHRVAIDVRVVAATNRDLRAEINRGTFRADLYYRLNTVRLYVPPLRDRPEDIGLLARHFYQQFAPDAEAPTALIDAFELQNWPGNVRELRNAIERALLLGPEEMIRIAKSEHATQRPPGRLFDPDLSFRASKELAVGGWERAYLDELMGQHDGKITRAARAAKMDRNHLRELLRKHEL